MLEIYPKLTSSFSKCPACGCELSSPSSLFFYGRYILADIECTCCDIVYYHSYPAKDKEDPACFAFTKDGKHITYKSESNKWNVWLLVQALKNEHIGKTIFEIEKRNSSKTITLVNFMGQTLQSVREEMAKIQLASKNTSQCIFIIPDHLKHLVSGEIAEVWSAKFKTKNNSLYTSDFDEFVKSQFSRFNHVLIYNTEYGSAVKNNVGFIKKVYLLIKYVKNRQIKWH